MGVAKRRQRALPVAAADPVTSCFFGPVDAGICPFDQLVKRQRQRCFLDAGADADARVEGLPDADSLDRRFFDSLTQLLGHAQAVGERRAQAITDVYKLSNAGFHVLCIHGDRPFPKIDHRRLLVGSSQPAEPSLNGRKLTSLVRKVAQYRPTGIEVPKNVEKYRIQVIPVAAAASRGLIPRGTIHLAAARCVA